MRYGVLWQDAIRRSWSNILQWLEIGILILVITSFINHPNLFTFGGYMGELVLEQYPFLLMGLFLYGTFFQCGIEIMGRQEAKRMFGACRRESRMEFLMEQSLWMGFHLLLFLGLGVFGKILGSTEFLQGRMVLAMIFFLFMMEGILLLLFSIFSVFKKKLNRFFEITIVLLTMFSIVISSFSSFFQLQFFSQCGWGIIIYGIGCFVWMKSYVGEVEV
ncbi:MAG: hypothetical protein K6C69_00360 [Lachnospiraceae bacterium]|nr:hypothetical protein [Lachnospiraceae bacterium]